MRRRRVEGGRSTLTARILWRSLLSSAADVRKYVDDRYDEQHMRFLCADSAGFKDALVTIANS